jgi:hypothetical protein
MEVPTTYINESGNYYFYQATINSFSYFYIGQSIIKEQQEPLPPSPLSIFIRANLFWIIVGIISIILVFVSIKLVKIISKRRENKMNGFTGKELKELKELNKIKKEDKKITPLFLPSVIKNRKEMVQQVISPKQVVQKGIEQNSIQKRPEEKINKEKMKMEISQLKEKIIETEKKQDLFDEKNK